MEELSDHPVNRSECVEGDGSSELEEDFVEDFPEHLHAKSSWKSSKPET